MKIGIVYVHRFPNEKGYVGKTIQSLKERTREDFSGYKTQPLLWNAIQKYGVENITTEILHEDVPESCLKALEQIEILRQKTHKSQNGYNYRWGGEGWDSETARESNRQRVKEGTHHFQDSEKARERALKRVEEGTHPWAGDGEFQREMQENRVAEGTHPWVGTTWRDHPKTTAETRAAWRDVDRIYCLNIQGFSEEKLGKMYGVSSATIHEIIKSVVKPQPEQLRLF